MKKSTSDLITENSEYLRGGHQTCKLAVVPGMGANPMRTNRALWILEHKPAILPTHDLFPTCDLPDCVATSHHELRPRKLQKPPTERAMKAWEENRALKLQVSDLQAKLSEAQSRLKVFETALALGHALTTRHESNGEADPW